MNLHEITMRVSVEDALVDRLDMLISRLKGECVDCETPCGKAHKSHTGECECCKYMREW